VLTGLTASTTYAAVTVVALDAAGNFSPASNSISIITTDGATAQSFTYTFSGNGNWNNAANWACNLIPPATLPAFSSIIIDHAAGGQCLLNVPQNIAKGASFIVKAGKNLLVNGGLLIQ
jgi:hypothetical protein